MPRRILFGFIISLLILPVFFQITHVSAHEHERPITSPITSPVSFFDLSGEVTYHQLGRLFGACTAFGME